MQEFARQLGVSRATLFRWVWSRGDLMGEVVWSVVRPSFERARLQSTAPRGGAKVAVVMPGFCEAAID